ncbi:hypothetical protein GCM10020218_080640 [Dactylosporangium vinaceum]
MKRSRSISRADVSTTDDLVSVERPGADLPGAGFNAAIGNTVNPSTHRGGTLVLDNSGDWDSIDPGNTYVAYAWNFARLYARTLTTYAAPDGPAGAALVPDLAADLGRVSDDGLTWTYRLKPNLRMENGAVITSYMIKHAIERSASYSPTLPIGPVYWRTFLTGPDGIATPDPATVVFRLRRPMAEFDYLVSMPQTAPVPPECDTGPEYWRQPLSSGPYRIRAYIPGRRLQLVRNAAWDPASDPVRRQLADAVVVNLNVDADAIDRRLLTGEVHLAVEGGGVQRRGQAAILDRPARRSNADNPLNGFVWYAAISTAVPPLGQPPLSAGGALRGRPPRTPGRLRRPDRRCDRADHAAADGSRRPAGRLRPIRVPQPAPR